VEHLKPTGLDAFAIDAPDLEQAPEPALAPFVRKNNGQLFLGRASDAESFVFRLEFGLPSANGAKARSFSVLRSSCADPLWLDANVFVSSGFTAALDAALQRACCRLQFFGKFNEFSDQSTMEDAVPLGIN
jgi:hypothetical protein